MVYLGVDKILIEDVIDLLGLYDLTFLQEFQGHKLSILLVLGDFDLAEPT